MFGKQRCYLCGGKLDNGRCTVCGLDNTRKQKKNYRLNESSLSPAGEKAVERAERGRTKAGEGRSCRKEGAESRAGRGKDDYTEIRPSACARWEGAGNCSGEADADDPPYGRPAVRRYADKKISGLDRGGGPDHFGRGPIVTELLDSADSEADRQVWTEEDYDPYQFAARELSDSGDVYDALLGQGKYYVGVNIPEGSYTVELADGEGSLNVDDPENGIYLYQYFGYDEDYGDKTLLEDVRLYEGRGRFHLRAGQAGFSFGERAGTVNVL